MKTIANVSFTIALAMISSSALAQEKQDSDLEQLPPPAPQTPPSTWGTGATQPAPATSAPTPTAKSPQIEASPRSELPPRASIRYSPAPVATPPTENSSPSPEAQQGVAPLGDARRDTRESFWKIGMGVRGGRIDNAGFDPFANDSELWQYSLTASRTLFATHRFSFAAGASWDVGQRADTQARGFNAGIAVHRLTVPLEARFHAASWMYGFFRVAPGADYRKAWIEDPSSTTGELDSSAWAFATDFSLGGSFLMAPQSKPQSHVPRFWVTPEVGYAWSTSTEMNLAPKGAADDPQPSGTTNLQALALRGPFARVAVDLSF